MTKTETPECHFCQGPATGIKTEVEREWDDANGGREVEVKIERTVCGSCAAHWYDGTEEYPGLLPLA
jgi:hypothetical protein